MTRDPARWYRSSWRRVRPFRDGECQAIRQLARQYDVHLHTDLAEYEDEAQFCLHKVGIVLSIN